MKTGTRGQGDYFGRCLHILLHLHLQIRWNLHLRLGLGLEETLSFPVGKKMIGIRRTAIHGAVHGYWIVILMIVRKHPFGQWQGRYSFEEMNHRCGWICFTHTLEMDLAYVFMRLGRWMNGWMDVFDLQIVVSTIGT